MKLIYTNFRVELNAVGPVHSAGRVAKPIRHF